MVTQQEILERLGKPIPEQKVVAELDRLGPVADQEVELAQLPDGLGEASAVHPPGLEAGPGPFGDDLRPVGGQLGGRQGGAAGAGQVDGMEFR